MKRLLTLTILIMAFAVTNTFAQEAMRGRVINYTDYGKVAESVEKGTKKIGTRASAPLPCMGSPKVPVVLVEFSDLPFTVAGQTSEEVHANYDKYFNQLEEHVGQNYGSVKQYFIDQSDGQFSPDFSVIGPIKLPKSYAYYGSGARDMPSRLSEFYSSACKQAMTDYDIDWTVFDNNNNGVVDFIFFIFAGEGENAGGDVNTIWPCEKVSTVNITVNDETIAFGGYGCTNEKYVNGSKVYWDGVGTCIHELSHGIGLPDFYDTKAYSYGLDYWDIMDSGCYTYVSGFYPVAYSAYEREFMGWRKMQEIKFDADTTLIINPIENKGEIAYKICNPASTNGDEYFILENRQNIGWDRFLGRNNAQYGVAHGLLIYHVDYKLSAWTSNTVNATATHQRMTIVPADGTLDSYSLLNANSTQDDYNAWLISQRGDAYPGYTNKTEMSDYSVFTGGVIDMRITEITENQDGTISVKINNGVKTPSFTVGDPNNDGEINVGDFTAIANHILGNDGPTFIKEAADVNGDGDIDVGDLTAEANLILNGSDAANAKSKQNGYNLQKVKNLRKTR